MGFTLDPAASPRREIRRVVVERLDDAIDRLTALARGTQSSGEIETAIHEVRKRCKEARGLARLVQPALGRDYRRFNDVVREAAGELAEFRNAHALFGTVTTLSDVRPGAGDGALDRVVAVWGEESAAATDSIRATDPRLASARNLLVLARSRAEQWELPKGFGPIEDGLERTYRRGRSGLRDMRDGPTDDRSHECRKAVKHLWYQLRFLRAVAPSVISPAIEALDGVADALGDDHDLAVVLERIDHEPERFGGEAVAAAAAAIVREVRGELQRAAVRAGATVYAETPGAFTTRLRRYWSTSRRDGVERPVGGISEIVTATEERGRDRAGDIASAENPAASASDGRPPREPGVELERKWLVDRLPADVGAGVAFRQGYVALDGDVSVRIRSAADEGATLTLKAGAGVRRTEIEWEISAATFDVLWPLTDGRRVSKRRHRLDVGGRVAELDVFDGDLLGLVVVEVEFDSEDSMNDFVGPEWFGRDVSDDLRYTNASLSVHGRPSDGPDG